jgi:hypothetical protein
MNQHPGGANGPKKDQDPRDFVDQERDLNQCGPICTNGQRVFLNRPSTIAKDGLSLTHYTGLHSKLVNRLGRSGVQFALGCPSWLRSWQVLEKLEQIPYGVALVVQKEEYLRSDLPGHPDYGTENAKRRVKYKQFFCKPRIWDFPESVCPGGILPHLVGLQDGRIEPIRCFGVCPKKIDLTNTYRAPTMHHKFLVFCRCAELPPDQCVGGRRYHIEPFMAWYGSSNMTNAGSRSLDVITESRDRETIDGLVRAWSYVLAMSEPMEWRYRDIHQPYRVDEAFLAQHKPLMPPIPDDPFEIRSSHDHRNANL